MSKTGIKTNPLFAPSAKPKDVITQKRNYVKTQNADSVRITHYLAKTTENLIQKLKLEVRSKKGIRISNSRIVEIAIDLLSQDHNEKKEESYLSKNVNVKA